MTLLQSPPASQNGLNKSYTPGKHRAHGKGRFVSPFPISAFLWQLRACRISKPIRTAMQRAGTKHAFVGTDWSADLREAWVLALRARRVGAAEVATGHPTLFG
jgi:hypothetical protein